MVLSKTTSYNSDIIAWSLLGCGQRCQGNWDDFWRFCFSAKVQYIQVLTEYMDAYHYQKSSVLYYMKVQFLSHRCSLESSFVYPRVCSQKASKEGVSCWS